MTDTTTILDWLIKNVPGASRTTLRDMVSGKRVSLNGKPVKSLKQPVKAGDKVAVGGAPPKTAILAGNLKVIHEDPDVMVIDKPPGLLTATHEDETRGTVLEQLGQYAKKSAAKGTVRLVHRLDRDASGLLVFARTDAAYDSLKQQFFDHTVTRRYDVAVHKRMPVGEVKQLQHVLWEDDHGLVKISRHPKKGKEARLEYKVIASDQNLAHLQCTLFTGRKHQIRVQLKAAGHPVCGDPVYGTPLAKEGKEPPFRLALHASHLTFTHPRSGKKISFDSSPPAAMARLFPVAKP